MIQRWLRLKTWKKWTFGISGLIALIFLFLVIFFIYRVKTVDLDEIIAKHNVNTAANIEDDSDSKKDQDSNIPNLLEKPLEKANSLTDKQIDSEDAIDVAAILMNSGLSLKEMSYLTGNSTSDLTTEEKQKIRDLLLKKLSPKEIEALRSITSQYGKYLVILDPNYPIELVGVQDEKERERILKELEEKKLDQAKENASTAEPTQPVPSEKPPQKNAETNEQELLKKKLDAKYTEKFSNLQKNSQIEVDSLTEAVKDYIFKSREEGKEVTISDLQANFLSDITDAESKTDQQFEKILSEAQKEYEASSLDVSGLDTFKTQYEQSKNKARSTALSQILSVWKTSSK
ncbi:hypothetical protein H7B90_17715 [Cohnella xylanilytica]|uniref:Uncharacterized protein n=1 Tax=Cohnella xylanilytica TaxID=557555 RepID=A0A841U5E3_9BACL|nr:hypothetical protein [Cohnella xylanilytica]MBB6693244.1 hypothetical protein [Cohnella xylanilytica]